MANPSDSEGVARSDAAASKKLLKRLLAAAVIAGLGMLVRSSVFEREAQQTRDDGSAEARSNVVADQLEFNESGFVTDDSRSALLAVLDSGNDEAQKRALGEIKTLSPVARVQLLSHEAVVERLVPLLQLQQYKLTRYLYRWFTDVPPSARGPLVAALDSQDVELQEKVLQFWRFHNQSLTGLPAFEPRIVPALLRLIRQAAESMESSQEPLERRKERLQLDAMSLARYYLEDLDEAQTVVNVACQRLRHADHHCRINAVEVLRDAPRQFKDEIATALLEQLKVETNGGVVPPLCYALLRVGDHRLTESIAALLNRQPLFESYYHESRSELSPEETKAYEESMITSICLALHPLGDKRVIPALRKRLHLHEPNVIWALGALGDTESRPVFLQCLRAKDVEVQVAAARALSGVADPEMFDALYSEFGQALGEKTRNDDLIRALAWAMCRSDEQRAATTILASLCFWPHGELPDGSSPVWGRDPRIDVLRSLGQPVVRYLIDEQAVSQRDSKTAPVSLRLYRQAQLSRALRIRILSDMLSDGCLLFDDEQAVVALLVRELSSDRLMLRERAASRLSGSQKSAAANRLLAFLESDKATPESLTKFTARSLEWIAKTGSATDRIEAFLSHDAISVREAAMQALVAADHPRASELLVGMLDDPLPSVQAVAAEQLGSIGDRAAGERLWWCLDAALSEKQRDGLLHLQSDSNPLLLSTGWTSSKRFVGALAQSLGVLSVKDASRSLTRLLSDGSMELRVKALLALVQCDDPRATELFSEAVNGFDFDLRHRVLSQTAVLARLASSGHGEHPLSRQALEAILKLYATDSRPRVQSDIALALHGLSEPRALDALRDLCGHSDRYIRQVALVSLMATNAPDRIDILHNRLNDRKSDCRSNALKLIQKLYERADEHTKLTLPASIAAVIPLLKDDQESVITTTLTTLEILVSRDDSGAPTAIDAINQLTTPPRKSASASLLQQQALATLSRLAR